MFDKIFISYAKEDLAIAEEIYDKLKEWMLEPWMDKRDIRPGENWNFRIQTEMRKANFIILLLSEISISKRSYVQREFKTALDYCREKLDSDIYTIPIKIDDCIIPDEVGKFHWIEYNTEDFHMRLIEAIDFQKEKLIKEEEYKRLKNLNKQTVLKEYKGKLDRNRPHLIYEIIFQVFKNEDEETLREFNTLIHASAIESLMEIRKTNYFDFYDDGSLEDWSRIDSTHFEKMEFRLIKNSFVSFTNFKSWYYTGSAHDFYYTSGYNYLLNPLIRFSIFDYFNNKEEAISILLSLAKANLMEHEESDFSEDPPKVNTSIFHRLPESEDDLKNYYFKEDCLVFIFNIYELSAFAMGEFQPEVSFIELLSAFKGEKKFTELIKTLQQ